MTNSLPSASVEFDIQFFDIDPMNIVWHGNYVKYLEIARCEMLRTFNYDYPDMRDSGYMWPIVDMRLKYVAPATFAQRIEVTATLKEYENRMKIEYLIKDAKSGQKLTKAYTVQVAVCMESNEMQYVSPPVLLEKLGLKHD